MGSVDPAVKLTEYQKNWVQDASRWKIGVVTRQGGKSFSGALEPVLDCAEHKSMWVFLSAGERQSKELMSKAAMHARAVGIVIKELVVAVSLKNPPILIRPGAGPPTSCSMSSPFTVTAAKSGRPCFRL